MIAALAFTAWFALANLWSGGKFKRWVGDLPGRSHYYSSLATLIAGGAVLGVEGAVIGLSFLIWRLPGWYGALDAGANEGGVWRDVAMMSLRGLAFGPYFLWRFFLSNSDPLATLDLTALYCLAAGCVAQGAAYWFANHLMRRHGWIWWAEGLGGAAWGLALWWAWASI